MEADYEVECPECDRTVTKETEEEAESLVESHNNSQHNGENIAHVVGEHDPLIDFIEILETGRLKRAVRAARYEEHQYRIVCPVCEKAKTPSEKSDEINIRKTIKTHNTVKHDGDNIAGVAKEDVDGTTANRDKPYMSFEDRPDAAEILADLCDERNDNIITSPELSEYISE